MTDLIGLIGSGITMTKGIFEVAREYNNANLIKQISDLTIQLAQAQTEAAEMMTELRNLKAELEERDNNPLEYSSTIYFDSNGELFCPACYDDRKKRIHLKVIEQTGGVYYRCPICHNNFGL